MWKGRERSYLRSVVVGENRPTDAHAQAAWSRVPNPWAREENKVIQGGIACLSIGHNSGRSFEGGSGVPRPGALSSGLRACARPRGHGTPVFVSHTVLGEVQRVTFENEETGFRVIRLGQVSGIAGTTSLTVVGVMQALGPGTRVRVSGRIDEDPRHGKRLKAESVVVVAPDTLEGLEKFLGSGVVKGIGPGFAKRIVRYFGLESLRVLDHEPHRLAEVPGLGSSRVEQAAAAWKEHTAVSNVLLALQSHGASPALASKIVRHFGEKAAEVVQQSPYRLAIEVSGVGFKTADRLARSQGLSLDHPERAQAGVLHELRTLADSGHCLCPRDALLARAAEMLQIAEGHVDAAIDALWAAGHLVVEGDAVFLGALHRAEVHVARRILALLAAPAPPVPRLSVLLEAFEAKTGIALAPAQRRAVEAAGAQKLLVVTGGPGVGKTTIVQAILATFAEQNLRVHLAAPTGRAAKRLSESTGRRAQTLHRLLEVEGRGNRFARHEENPLETDLLIVDEASMIDIHLASSLLDAVPNAARLVIVGDADQLPSVGPGAFLHDLIASEVVPVVRLDVIFRQAGQSGIVENSHRILRGEEPQGSEKPEGDFFIIPCRNPEHAVELIEEVVTTRIPKRFGFSPRTDMQVLTPMHRGGAGTIALNQVLQARINPGGKALKREGYEIRVGDKVLQIKNDYNKDVFNGDLGEVTEVDIETPTVTVEFEAEEGARNVVYEKAEISQLALAYATSIHKSQGSEYPVVVIPLLTQHFVMLSRNLLYTAVTRAKKLCVLIVDRRALSIALAETRKEERQTKLSDRLSGAARLPTDI